MSTADLDGPVVVVHPEDVNLADAKAKAADLGATIVGNPYVPRGQVFVVNPKALLPKFPPVSRLDIRWL